MLQILLFELACLLASTLLPSIFLFSFLWTLVWGVELIWYQLISFLFSLSLALVGLSFSGAIGLTFLLLGCALEQYGYELTDCQTLSIKTELNNSRIKKAQQKNYKMKCYFCFNEASRRRKTCLFLLCVVLQHHFSVGWWSTSRQLSRFLPKPWCTLCSNVFPVCLFFFNVAVVIKLEH